MLPCLRQAPQSARRRPSATRNPHDARRRGYWYRQRSPAASFVGDFPEPIPAGALGFRAQAPSLESCLAQTEPAALLAFGDDAAQALLDELSHGGAVARRELPGI